jgi:hypothetical protein
MSREDDNKAIVGRWFTHFWGKEYNAAMPKRPRGVSSFKARSSSNM